MLYYSLDPWGGERADLNAGIIASTVANAQIGSRKGRAFTPKDFMPKYGTTAEERPEPDSTVMKAHVVTAFGARLRKRTPEEKARVIYQHKNGEAD